VRFIPPMLAIRSEVRRLADPRYIAEPKLGGQRAQLHVREHRTVQAYGRPGRELIRLPGLAWLREIRWQIASGVLDGEAVAGDESEGIQVVFQARNRQGRLWRSPRSTSWRSMLTPPACARARFPGRGAMSASILRTAGGREAEATAYR